VPPAGRRFHSPKRSRVRSRSVVDGRQSRPAGLFEVDPRLLVDVAGGPHRGAGALLIEEPHQVLHLKGLVGQRSAGALAGRVLDLPAGGHESVESLVQSQRRLHHVVREIVEGEEETTLSRVVLPGGGAVVAGAGQRRAAVGVFLDGDVHGSTAGMGDPEV